MSSYSGNEDRPNKRLIFRRYFIHPKTGKRVYPRNGGVFPIWVDDDQPK